MSSVVLLLLVSVALAPLLSGSLYALALELRDPPQNLDLNMGQNASLMCRSTINSDAECQWMRNGQPVVVGKGKWKTMYDWLGHPSQGDCSLRLIGTSLEHHSGVWQCTVADLFTVGNTVTSKTVDVVLLVEPREVKVDVVGSGMWVGALPIKDGKVTVQEGTNITARCSVCCGSPNASISWRKITPTRSIALSTVRTFTQQSNYTWLSVGATEVFITRDDNRAILNCTVFHKTFRGRKGVQFTLNVLFAPKPIHVPRNLTGYLYDQVILHCPLRGNPVPSYKWFFQGENGTWIAISDSDGDDLTLTLEAVNASQAGLYNCTATSLLISRRYEVSGLIHLSLIEGGAFRALKTTDAIILGVVLGVVILAGVIGFVIWLKKRKTGRTYVSANDKESTPEGPVDAGGGTGADGETQLNQMAWNTESSPKEDKFIAAEKPSNKEIVYAELSLTSPTKSQSKWPNPREPLPTIYAQLKF